LAEFAGGLAGVLRAVLKLDSTEVELRVVETSGDGTGGVIVVLEPATSTEQGFLTRLLVQRTKSKANQPGEIVFDATQSTEIEELCGHLAGRLGHLAPIDVGNHRQAAAALARLAGRHSTRVGSKSVGPALLASALGVGVAVSIATAMLLRIWQVGSVPERFGFEGDIRGWTAETAPGARGCTGIQRAQAGSKSGNSALRMALALDGRDLDKRSGEAWVNLRQLQLAGLRAPLDLQGTSLVGWASVVSAVSGEALEEVGFQLFVKDQHFRGCYGPWVTASRDRWLKLTVEANCDSPHHHVDTGYDRHSIVAVGVKVAVTEGATGSFAGAVHVDSIGW
jgi:hypothetical protein